MTTHFNSGHRVLASLVLAFTCFRLMSQTPLNPPSPPPASIPAAEAWLAGAALAPEFRVPATREAWNTRRAEIRTTLDAQLMQLQQGNAAKLDEMRHTVDEKLQSTLQARLGESFKQVADRLEQVLGVPALLMNDAQAAAWGEFSARGDGLRDLMFVTVSTGIGAGVVLDGRLRSGRTGLAGHLGHVGGGTAAACASAPCSCGRGACLERRASGSAMAQDLAALGLGACSARQWMTSPHQDLPAVQDWLDTATRALAQAIADAHALLPEYLTRTDKSADLAGHCIEWLTDADAADRVARQIKFYQCVK